MLNLEIPPMPVRPALPMLGNIGETSLRTDLGLHGRVQDPLTTPGNRRRPDRSHIKNSHLIRLLRNPAAAGEPDLIYDLRDGLRVARGIMVGLAFSVPIWVLITLLGYVLIHAG